MAVLMGGPSAEREVSLSSGHECALALEQAGYAVLRFDAGASLASDLQSAAPDVVFNALHGRWGEDGCVQGILEWLGLPYTHSGVLASSLAMDKTRSKEVFVAAGLPVMQGQLMGKEQLAQGHPFKPPYVIKPNNEGSSVGVHIVPEGANRPPVLGDDVSDLLLVEKFAAGRELTVTVLGDRALTVTDILTDTWYDYAAKYQTEGSRHVVPAHMPPDIFETCKKMALRAHNALGCRGMSRTDFRWDAAKGKKGLIILEVNTQPGMTPTSLSPEQAQFCGISFAQLCTWLVEDASCNR